MKSGRKPSTSSRIVRAIARNPRIVIRSLGMSNALKALHQVAWLIDRSRWGWRTFGKTYQQCPVNG